MRRSGRTTRVVDTLVQALFEKPNGWLVIYDHYYGIEPRMKDLMRVKKILEKRMQREHNISLAHKIAPPMEGINSKPELQVKMKYLTKTKTHEN